MAAQTSSFTIETTGKGTYELTHEIERKVAETGLSEGVVTVFVRHTSASLVIMENADPSARVDLEAFFDRLVPEDSVSEFRAWKSAPLQVKSGIWKNLSHN